MRNQKDFSKKRTEKDKNWVFFSSFLPESRGFKLFFDFYNLNDTLNYQFPYVHNICCILGRRNIGEQKIHSKVKVIFIVMRIRVDFCSKMANIIQVYHLIHKFNHKCFWEKVMIVEIWTELVFLLHLLSD